MFKSRQSTAIAAVVAALAVPAFAAAQPGPTSIEATAGSSPANVRPQAEAVSRTRAEVSAEVQRAMRDGTWRRATGNRSWPGQAADDQRASNRPQGGAVRPQAAASTVPTAK